MKLSRFVSAAGVALLAAFSVGAQQNQGTVAALEFQTPKTGMTKQYEDGRKQKGEWHKQQKDPQALLVWETLSGDQTGTYIVGRLGQHWSDFDKPAIPDATDLEEFNKVVGNYVQSVVTRYYENLSKVSNPEMGGMPSKFAEVVTFHVREGHAEEFQSAMARIHEAAQKTNWPVHYEWYVLANGGPGGEYVIVLPRAKWADFEDSPNVKPFRKMIEEAFGGAETDSIIKRLDSSIGSSESSIIEFRQDLSYIPAK
jgi:hypothetical protein